MKNFDWGSFTMRILVKTTMNDVYRAWTSSGELERWFPKKATYFGSDRQVIAPGDLAVTGSKYQWSWFLHDEVENGKIWEANGKDHIQFSFAGDCVVDVKLSEKYNWIHVELSMKNIPTDDISKQEIRLGCFRGWHFYLVNLKSVLEGGLDLRNKDENFKPMINN